jgi:ketosteroid isomerase-like protein
MQTNNPVSRTILLALMFTALSGLAVRPLHAESKTAASKEPGERAVQTALQMIIDGYRTRDVNVLASPQVYFSDDNSDSHFIMYDVMPPLQDVGYQGIVTKDTQFLAATVGPIVVSWTDKHIDADGEFAFFYGIMHATATYKDGRHLDFNLRHTLIFKKIHGKYLIIHEHGSVPDASVGIEAPKHKS